MDDKEIWIAAYLAALSAGATNDRNAKLNRLTDPKGTAADIAEQAVKDYRGRWGDE